MLSSLKHGALKYDYYSFMPVCPIRSVLLNQSISINRYSSCMFFLELSDRTQMLLHTDQATAEVSAEIQTSQKSGVTGLAGESLGRTLNTPRQPFCLQLFPLTVSYYQH